MLLKLAWRNLWRNRRRSMIVLTAIVIGMVLLILLEAYVAGVLRQMSDDQIGSHVAHLQIDAKGFNDNKIVQSCLPKSESVEAVLRSGPSVAAYSKRVVTYGLVSSASNSSGISIIGVDPQKEEKITKIKSWIVDGRYLTGGDREIVIGRALAERLGVTLGDKIVLMASAVNGQVGSDVFRIAGLYVSSSNEFDKAFVYVTIGSAQRMLALGDQFHSIAILARNIDQVAQLQRGLASELGENYEVLSYMDLLPALMAILGVIGEAMAVYYVIIGAAVIFGIINTLLMSVFERIREFGVLMAMGMRNGKVFQMVVLEAFLLGVVGTVVGLTVGLACYYPMWKYGLDLSSFSEGLQWIGVSAIVHPVLTPGALVRILLSIPFISVLAAMYPAMKAIRLVPVKAIYYV